MNWTSITAISEVIGTLAVVVSVMYLAIQVRSGANALKTTMRDNAFQMLQEWNYIVASDPDLPSIIARGSRNFESLDVKDRARFIHMMFSMYKAFERLYLHYLEGSIDEGIWLQNKYFLASYLHQPGSRHYWEDRKGAFDTRFREVAETMPPPPFQSISNLVGEPEAMEEHGQ
jgi:hypothetical protein